MNKKKFLINMLVVFGILVYFLISKKDNLTLLQSSNYNFIVFIYSIIGISNIYIYSKDRISIFDSLNIINFIYFMMFIYYPLRDINKNETLFFGMQTENGTKMATIILFISYFSYIFGYFSKKSNQKVRKTENYSKNFRSKIFYVALMIWTIGFFANLFYIMKSGASLSYIFTLGKIGYVSKNGDNSLFGFIGIFGYLMIAPLFYIKEYSSKKWIFYFSYIMTLLFFILRGFRFVIVIIIVMFVVYYYTKNHKTPKLKAIILLLMILLLMITSLRIYRNDLRSGNETVALNNINFFETVEDSLYDNFSMYKPFYILVERIPKELPHTLGVKTFINPLIMFVPRILWKDKTFLGGGTSDNIYVKEVYRSGNAAICNFGEFYMDFGVIGCILFQYIFGVISINIKKNKDFNINSLIKYSIFIPLNLQIIIRGYMASNFNLILFIFLPIWIIEFLFFKRTNLKRGEYEI